jgi:iron(III) transport system substrate-binding protein
MIRPHTLLLLLPALAAIGCAKGGAPARLPILIYSPHGKEMLRAYEESYEALHPDHDVQWLDMGSQDVYDRLRTEKANPQADLWWGAPMVTFQRAEDEGLLERYVPSWDSSIAPEYRSGHRMWYGASLTPEVILYNSRLLSPQDAPADWDELLDPRWKGKIILRSPLASGTMRIIFAAMIDRENRRTGDSTAGFRWLQRLDANTRTYASDPTQLYLKIAREEGSVSVWNLPDVVIQRTTHDYPFGYLLPRSGTPIVTDGIALVHGAPHVREAVQFYEFVTSVESMVDQAARFARIPSRSDVPRDRLPSWMRDLDLRPLGSDWRVLAGREREWMRVWDERIKGSGAAAAEGGK